MPHLTIHSLDQARTALASAGDDGTELILESPAGAAGHQGIGWWLALLRLLKAEFPKVAFESVLDCGDAPGLALASINAGVPSARISGISADVRASLEAIAAQAGTRLIGEAP